eukprot:NODE_338_length_2930_cov_27.422515_g289_i0.p1 GENE.NODE_338_length_2930_cov_27.422515_g289_i0~~NODE_338_length_2930_cov_27.422515_g289_i0.p1  ORF type:complete len:507 (-),score=97.48 NODE_338_length_2930_cov_27.422515_g289_i0:1410-2864(-)
MYDTEGKPLFRNPAASNIYNGDLDSTFVEHFMDVDEGNSLLNDVLSGKVVHTETSVKGDRFHSVFAHLSCDPVTSKNMIILSEHDVSTSRNKERFLNIITHDLRTPVNNVKGYTELLCQTELTELQSEYIQAIALSGQYLATLADNVLNYSKVMSDVSPYAAGSYNCPNLVNDVCNIVKLQAEAKQLSLVADCEGPNQPQNVMGDKPKVFQVLCNLVGNAVKYTPPGGKVTVRTSMVKELPKSTVKYSFIKESLSPLLLFEVMDTGCGIAMNEFDVIFKEFRRGKLQNLNHHTQGFGLGLFTCSKLIQLMGGCIGVRNRDEGGALFWITIPTMAPNDDNILASPVSIPNPVVPVSDDTAKIRVLIAEDNLLTQKMMMHMLKPIFEITMVNNGLEAINALKDESHPPYALFMTDIVMPEMDGISCAKHIRKELSIKNIPIIGVTGSPESIKETDLFQAIIPKPFKKDDLVKSIIKFATNTPMGTC